MIHLRRPPWFALLLLLAGCQQEFEPKTIYPILSVSPSSLDFGEVVANEGVGELELFLSNAGPTGLNIDSLTFSDPAFSYTLPEGEDLELEPDESVTATVSFAPTAVAPYEASLVITSNDENPEQTFPVLGTGRPPYAPDIELRVDGVAANTLDFGVAAAGENKYRFFEIWNVGDAELQLFSVVRAGAGTFDLDDPSGLTIAPGGVTTLLVTYTSLTGEGDEGTIDLPSNDPDEGMPGQSVMSLVANGGGVQDYPEAVVLCPETIAFAQPVTVTLDGSASTDPFGGALTYAWEMVQMPAGVDADRTVSPTDAPLTELLIDTAGTWEVQLTVTSELGVPSVPAKCTIEAVPIDNLHVELTWNGGTSDLDLHLALEGTEFFTVPGEVSWCNPVEDWGVPGLTDDDGHISIDDNLGFGPETAGVKLPADGSYRVRVHAFDDGDDGDVTANVSLFLDGALEWSGSKVLERNEVWEVGTVNWPDKTFAVSTEDLWDAAGVRECR